MTTNQKLKLKRPVRLVLDYDGTLTINDTMSLLGTLPKHPTKLSWDEIVAAYLKDYEKYKAENFPWRNYDRTEYSAWLASRKWVEERSAQRVQDSGFFKGVTEEDVREAVKQAMQNGTLQLRPCWDALFRAFLPSSSSSSSPTSSTIEILSVNWSQTAIRAALEFGAATSPYSASLLPYISSTLPIHANEISDLTAPHGSSGQLIRPDGRDIRTNVDKLHFLTSSSPSFPSSPSSSSPSFPSSPSYPSSEDMFTIYIGDSPTDFDCLCAADLGVWICDVAEEEFERKRREVWGPLRYLPPRLRELRVVDLERDGKKELFYWARGFEEVVEVLNATVLSGDDGDGSGRKMVGGEEVGCTSVEVSVH